MLPTVGRVPPCIARELFRERRLSEKSLTGLVLICQKRGMWWYNKELAPDEMLCGERKTEPGALQVRGTVVWLKNRKGIPSGHYIREDIRSWVVKIFFLNHIESEIYRECIYLTDPITLDCAIVSLKL